MSHCHLLLLMCTWNEVLNEKGPVGGLVMSVQRVRVGRGRMVSSRGKCLDSVQTQGRARPRMVSNLI